MADSKVNMKYFLLFILFLSLFSCVKNEDTENVIQEMINENKNTEIDKDIILSLSRVFLRVTPCPPWLNSFFFPLP